MEPDARSLSVPKVVAETGALELVARNGDFSNIASTFVTARGYLCAA